MKKIILFLFISFSSAWADWIYIKSPELSETKFKAYLQMKVKGQSYKDYMQNEIFKDGEKSYDLLNQYNETKSIDNKVLRLHSLKSLPAKIYNQPLTDFLKELLVRIYSDLANLEKEQKEFWLEKKSQIFVLKSQAQKNWRARKYFPWAEVVYVNGESIPLDQDIALVHSIYQVVALSSAHREFIKLMSYEKLQSVQPPPATLVSGHCLKPEFSNVPLAILHQSQIIYSLDCQINLEDMLSFSPPSEETISEISVAKSVKKTEAAENKWLMPLTILSGVLLFQFFNQYDVSLGYVK